MPWPLLAALLLSIGIALVSPMQAQAQTRTVAGFECTVHHMSPNAFDDVWSALPDSVDRIRTDLGDGVLTGGEIHIVSDINHFLAEQGIDAQAPRWAQAIAIPPMRLIVLKAPDPNIVQTLTHELSHLAVHEAAMGHHVPRWFLEGFAMMQSDEFDLTRRMVIAEAALFGNTLPFENLDARFPPHHLSANLAYTQSFHLVQTIVDDYGIDKVSQWLSAVGQGADWTAAFTLTFTIRPSQLFRQWKDEVKVWYAWIPAAVSVTTVWAGLGFLAIIAFRRTRRRREVRLAAMEAAESELYGYDPDDELFR